MEDASSSDHGDEQEQSSFGSGPQPPKGPHGEPKTIVSACGVERVFTPHEIPDNRGVCAV